MSSDVKSKEPIQLRPTWKELFQGEERPDFDLVLKQVKTGQKPVKRLWNTVIVRSQQASLWVFDKTKSALKTLKFVINIPGVDWVAGLAFKKYLLPLQSIKYLLNRINFKKSNQNEETIMPEESPNKITAPEGIRLGAKTLDRVADALEDSETPGEITKTEWLSILQNAGADAWDAYRN